MGDQSGMRIKAQFGEIFELNHLNFSIVAYESEEALLATAPKENTIGLITTNKIERYVFSPEVPKNQTFGLVWIKTGDDPAYSFNALHKNEIRLQPLEAKLYALRGQSTKFHYLPAYIFRNGAWDFWWNGQLYCGGYEIQQVTGGWQSVADAGDTGMTAKAPTLSKRTTEMVATLSGTNRRGYISTVNMVDLSKHTKVTLDLTCFNGGNTSAVTFDIVDVDGNSVLSANVSLSDTYTLDISELTGAYYMRFYFTSTSSTSVSVTIKNIVLTR